MSDVSGVTLLLEQEVMKSYSVPILSLDISS